MYLKLRADMIDTDSFGILRHHISGIADAAAKQNLSCINTYTLHGINWAFAFGCPEAEFQLCLALTHDAGGFRSRRFLDHVWKHNLTESGIFYFADIETGTIHSIIDGNLTDVEPVCLHDRIKAFGRCIARG